MQRILDCAGGAARVAILAILLAGCSTMEVSSDYDPAADFAGLKTFAWLPEPKARGGDPRIDHDSLLAKRIRATVAEELKAKGYSASTLDRADFALGYHVTVRSKTDVQVVNRYYEYGPGWGGRYGYRYPDPYRNATANTVVFEYDLGTLLIDIVLPGQRELIWRGSATDEVNFSAGREAQQQKIKQAVHKILAGFPPK